MRTRYHNLDYLSLVLWLGLVAIGLIAIYSTTHSPASEFLLASVKQNFYRQLMWLGICIMGFGIALALPVRFYQQAAYPAYVLTLLLLTAALLFGRDINGAKSWISIGSFSLQSSELAKVGTILAVARLLSTKQSQAGSIRSALMAVALIALPALIIVAQNDTGTALVFFGLIPIMLFWSGLPLNILLLLLAPAVAGYLAVVYLPAAIGFSIVFTLGLYIQSREVSLTSLAAVFTGGTVLVFTLALSKLLKPHQVERILSFTNPEAYRFGAGFHLVQSKAAIGSGGLLGKGFMEGTQTQGAYVPEQSTDFVFSVIGEEFGFMGAVLVLVLFGALLTRLIYISNQIKHPFGVMLAVSTVGIYLIHIFINIGMATALLPVIGIPLPFLSYGGSALLANTAMMAIVLTLHMRRDDFSIYGY